MYIHITTNEQKTWKQLREDIYRGIPIPEAGVLKIFDYRMLEGSTVPTVNEDIEKVVEIAPIITDGRYYRAYEVLALSAEEIQAIFKESVPPIVTKRQMRLALLQSGLLPTVDTAISNSTDESMKIEWEYADNISRDWESLITMATALGLSELDIDNMFILAGSL